MAIKISETTVIDDSRVGILTEARIDNININGNEITSTNTNGNIAITPNGTGEVDISKVDINGGTIDGTVIGGSTPAAISGTTGTFSGNLTVDTNTLFVDATNNRVGVGTTSPAQPLTVQATTPIIQLVDSNLTTRVANIGGDNGNVTIDIDPAQTAASSFFSVDIDDTERLRITSTGNVGIQRTSPATALDVNGDVTITDKIIHSGDTNTAIRFPAADTVTVETAGSERMRVTSAGNVVVSSGSLQVDDISNAAGTGAPDFPNGVSVNSNPIPTAGSLSNRNKIINGNFDIWQRGTSGTGGYLADRWTTDLNGSTAAISRQSFTLGTNLEGVPNEPSYFHRTVVTSSAGASNFAIVNQRIESVRTFAGQTVTLSFFAKADGNKSIAVEFAQYFGATGSPSSTVDAIGVTTCALANFWQKFTVTASIPSISGKTLGTANNDSLFVNFWFDAGSDYNSRTNSLGQQSGTFDIAQVQLEAGDVATPFEMRSVGQELALCQRYYANNEGVGFGIYGSNNGTTAVASLALPVTMRVSPTLGLVIDLSTNGTNLVSGAIGPSGIFAQVNAAGAGLTIVNARYSVDAEL